DDSGQEQRLEHPRPQHSTIGEQSCLSFSRETLRGTAQSRPNRCNELLPRRRPLDQKFGPIIHAASECLGCCIEMSIKSPITVWVLRIVPTGSSSTDAPAVRTG